MRFFYLSLIFLQLALPAGEQVIKSAPIPNRILKQGEALLIQPESGPRFMRIALATKHLGKVEQKIIAGEKENWPDSEDSAAYLKVLRQICNQAAVNGDKPVVFSIHWHPDRVEFIYQGQVYPVENLSTLYLEKNLQLILIDRFGLSTEEAETLLQRVETP